MIGRFFSVEMPFLLPTAAWTSCQNSQPLRKATRRLIIACSFASISPMSASCGIGSGLRARKYPTTGPLRTPTG